MFGMQISLRQTADFLGVQVRDVRALVRVRALVPVRRWPMLRFEYDHVIGILPALREQVKAQTLHRVAALEESAKRGAIQAAQQRESVRPIVFSVDASGRKIPAPSVRGL